jgi:hypothetical protein
MSRRPNTVEEVDDEPVLVEESIAVNDEFKTARIKGTWTMYWGSDIYEFVDGHRYRLPALLWEYLRQSGNIYDTL